MRHCFNHGFLKVREFSTKFSFLSNNLILVFKLFAWGGEVCVSVCVAYMGVLGGEQRVLQPMELESQATVTHPVWVSETKFTPCRNSTCS